MKYVLIFITLLVSETIFAQGSGKKAGDKVKNTAEKINQKSNEINQSSAEVAEQARQTAENVKSTIKNVKAVLKVFEPIFSFHFKKRKQGGQMTTNSDYVTYNSESDKNSNTSNPDQNSSQNSNVPPPPPPPYSSENFSQPENDTYNDDGTMFLGHQNSGRYGNCLNLLEGTVMGMGEAEEEPQKIDLIFFSQYGGLGYSFESPFDAPTINEGVAVKKWKARNETEIAETRLSIADFEKITTNSQLLNAVKSATGFSAGFYTPNKMDGRVFAIRLMQDDREVNALLGVYKQYGTAGGNGYLKIKIKVQAIKAQSNGSADPASYIR